jgi:hypothetical protein
MTREREMTDRDALRVAEQAIDLLMRLSLHVDVRHASNCERCRVLIDEVLALDVAALDAPEPRKR